MRRAAIVPAGVDPPPARPLDPRLAERKRELEEAAAKDAHAEVQLFLQTDAGRSVVKREAQRAKQKSAFHAKLNPGHGLRALTKVEAQTVARNDLVAQALVRHMLQVRRELAELSRSLPPLEGGLGGLDGVAGVNEPPHAHVLEE